ncbi:MAG: hypothetical protein VB093_01205, partial [Propionicimonas sp.]|nr:hypothetical protein [Propionicimonas sp.]
DVIVQLACDVGRGDQDGSFGRKHRYVAEILEVTPGERPRGFATNTIFRYVPGQCAVAHTRADTLWDELIAAGFDAFAFEREMATHRGQ